MPASIRVNGAEATISGGVWTSDDRDLLRALQRGVRREPGRYYPDVDTGLAQRAVEQLGGEVLDVELDDDDEGDRALIY